MYNTTVTIAAQFLTSFSIGRSVCTRSGPVHRVTRGWGCYL